MSFSHTIGVLLKGPDVGDWTVKCPKVSFSRWMERTLSMPSPGPIAIVGRNERIDPVEFGILARSFPVLPGPCGSQSQASRPESATSAEVEWNASSGLSREPNTFGS
jgi:hypothetical protein